MARTGTRAELRNTRGILCLAGLGLLILAAGRGHSQESPPAASRPASMPAPARMTAEEVFRRFLEATGGQTAHERVRTVVAHGRLTVPAAKLSAAVVIRNRTPDRIVSTIDFPGAGVSRQGYDGKTGWIVSGEGQAKILQGADLASLSREAHATPELHWRRLFRKAEYAGVQDVDGRLCHAVVVSGGENAEMTRYYDRESGLLSALTATTKTPLGAFTVQVSFGDYRRVGGVVMAHRQSQKAMGQEQIVTFDRIEINVDLPDDVFEPPEEVRALLRQRQSPSTRPAEPKS